MTFGITDFGALPSGPVLQVMREHESTYVLLDEGIGVHVCLSCHLAMSEDEYISHVTLALNIAIMQDNSLFG